MSEQFKVEPGIPIPPLQRGNIGGSNSVRYPFRKMSVGDSFFVPENGTHPLKLQSSMTHYRKKLGTRYTQRRVPGGHRVWRVA